MSLGEIKLFQNISLCTQMTMSYFLVLEYFLYFLALECNKFTSILSLFQLFIVVQIKNGFYKHFGRKEYFLI